MHIVMQPQQEKIRQRQKQQADLQQQLKRRRREKVMSRSQIVDTQQIPTQHKPPKRQTLSRGQSISAYQMFKNTKKYQQAKKYLQILSIVLGVGLAIAHVLVEASSSLFSFVFVMITVSSVVIEFKRLQNFSSFEQSNGAIEDPLISKVTNIKQLQIANKVLSIQSAASPVTKLLASFFLSLLAINYVYSKTK